MPCGGSPNAPAFRWSSKTILPRNSRSTSRKCSGLFTSKSPSAGRRALTNEASGQIARDYLAKRGVTDEAVKLFPARCSPEAWDDTVNWAKSKGHDLAVVEQAGLVIRKGRHATDITIGFVDGLFFRSAMSKRGSSVSAVACSVGTRKQAKYVNSPETPIFTKGKVFFGLDKSKRPLLDAESAIICEGQLDLIACFMAGVQNVVAPQGTALTPDHARILKRYVEEVVLCFDADNAGQNAAIRSLDPLLAAGCPFVWLRFPTARTRTISSNKMAAKPSAKSSRRPKASSTGT